MITPILVFVGFLISSPKSHLVIADDPLHSSDVRVAQCRAQCLDKFTWVGWTPSDTLCQEEPDCFMCWESCDLLNQNFVVWGSMCSHSDICFPGCQQSCGFYLQDNISGKTKPTFTLKFTRPIEFVYQESTHTLQLSWQKPEAIGLTDDSNDTKTKSYSANLVYAVVRRARISGEVTQWQHVTQTSELMTSLDINTLPPSATVDFKVIVAISTGMAGQLVTSYHVSSGVVMPQDSKSTLPTRPVNNLNSESGSGLSTDVAEGVLRWQLHLVALHANVKLGSVDAVITWAAPGLTGNFLVTWEVKEGTFAITGHLYTDSTTVSLTLWPDAVYSVQVELVSSALEKALRSEPLTVDTRTINGLPNKDGSLDALSVSKQECNTTLIIASIAVSASLLLLLVGSLFVIRRCHRKNAKAPKCDALQRMGAIRRKMPLTPPPLEVNGGCTKTISPISPPPVSSSLDERLSAFRVFFENLDAVAESFSPKQTDFAYSMPPTIPEVPVAKKMNSHQINRRCDSLFITMGDGILEDSSCVFDSTLPTEKLLTKAKAKRSFSTAI